MAKPTLRAHDPGRFAHGTGRCQVCGVPVGKSITHCLRCRNIQTPLQNQTPARAASRTSLLPLLAALLVAGIVAAAWYYRHQASAESVAVEAATVAEAEPGSVPQTTPLAPSPVPPNAPLVTAPAVPAPPVLPPPVATRPKQPPPRVSTRPVKLSARCRACGGSGRMRSNASTRTCPICRGSPVKIRWVSPDRKLCSHCSGFGRVMEMRHGTQRPTTCHECRGTGLVKKNP